MPTGYCRQCSRPFADLRHRLCGSCYQRARRAGLIQGWVDAAPVRAHIEALHAAGLGQRRIAELARIDRSQIRNISVGRRAHDKSDDGPAKLCHPRTAAAILAVPVPEPDPKEGICIDCGDRRHSAGRPRCNECHKAYAMNLGIVL